jgi:hemerythrin-like metal-binding protein
MWDDSPWNVSLRMPIVPDTPEKQWALSANGHARKRQAQRTAKAPLQKFAGGNGTRKEKLSMPIMTWTEEMSVGVKTLDEDHKLLIGMLNELNDGIESGRARGALESVIDGLFRYTRTHFDHEEKLFAQTGYPGAAAHKAEHERLIRRTVNLQARFESGQSLELSLEAMAFLQKWLTDHIQGSDQKYKPYLNAKGIK